MTSEIELTVTGSFHIKKEGLADPDVSSALGQLLAMLGDTSIEPITDTVYSVSVVGQLDELGHAEEVIGLLAAVAGEVHGWEEGGDGQPRHGVVTFTVDDACGHDYVDQRVVFWDARTVVQSMDWPGLPSTTNPCEDHPAGRTSAATHVARLDPAVTHPGPAQTCLQDECHIVATPALPDDPFPVGCRVRNFDGVEGAVMPTPLLDWRLVKFDGWGVPVREKVEHLTRIDSEPDSEPVVTAEEAEYLRSPERLKNLHRTPTD